MKAPKIPPNEPERLRDLESYEVLDTPPEGPFDDLTRLAAHLLDVPIALVSLVDTDRQWFKSRYGLDAPETPRDISFCGHVVAEERMLVVPDAFEDERFHDNPLVTADPRVRFYAGAPLRTPRGQVLGTLCAIDHQDRIVSDQQLEFLQALARQVMGQLELRRQLIETARLSAIVEATPDFVAIADAAKRPIYANRAARRTLGLGEDEELPASFAEWHPDWALERLESEGIPAALREGSWLGESAIRGAGGKEIPVLELLLSQENRDGKPRYLVTHARDMTELKKVDQLKNEFVSVVSHELRTPLTAIRGSLGLLEGGVLGDLPDEVMQLVQVASSSTQRLIRLINDILDLEKMESGKFELHRLPVDFAAVVSKAAAGVQGMAGEGAVEISAEVGELPPLRADEDRLVQVLTNLLSNAIKFSTPGSCVRVGGEVVGPDRLRAWVRDEGPGISPEDQSKLFGKFQQLDASDTRSRGGTGLGLAISKKIVEEHGGEIGVESQPGKGATFWFEIPCDAAAGHEPAPTG